MNPLSGGAGSLLVDPSGRPIPTGDERRRAEEELKNFMEKNKERFQDFWKAYGFGTRPPIRYDMTLKRWLWGDEK